MARRAIAWFFLVLFACSGVLGATTGKATPAKDKDDDYYELYMGLVDTVDQVERNYVKEVDRRELIEAAIKGVLSKLDPYSTYIPPEDLSRFRTAVDSEFGGIGIQVSVEGRQLKVLSPLVGTPAYRAGVMSGDRIVEINGKSTQGITIDEAVDRLKGKEGTKVTLTVIHAGRGKKESLSITRERIHIETVLSDRRKADDSWDYVLDPKQHIGYLRVTAFSRDTAGEMRKALEELKSQNMRALIVDLRFNPGGLLSAAVDVSRLFISEGTIVSTAGRNSPERVWEAHKEGAFEGFPMVVLVNHYSASASEIVSACLQDHKRAVIMGERTWGKGSVQNVIELEDGRAALKLTTAAYRRPSGKNIHRFEDAKESDEWGVMPDKGFQLKLSDAEMMALIDDRSRRDIVTPHASTAKQMSAQRPAADTAEAGSGSDEEGAPVDDSVLAPEGTSEENGESPAADAAAARADHAKAQATKPAFVDRQLQMAVEYVSGELARAK